MLKIRLFGTGRAKYHDRSLVGFPHQRPALLLCYLLLNRRYPHSREHLAATFWGDFPGWEARKYLRNALWKLRQILQSAGAPPDEYLFISDGNVAFVSTSSYWLDVEAFEKAAACCQDLSVVEMSDAQAGELENALQLYTGDLLESVYDDWCTYDRERLRLTYLSVLNKLLVCHAIRGNYERSLSLGRLLLSLDNTLERVHRQVICLEWLSGNRSAALAQYKLCAQILNEELGLQPMDTTKELYERLLHHRVPSPEAMLHNYFIPHARIELDPPTSLSKELLEKLHDLQDTVEQTGQTLRQLEGLISQYLLNAPRS